MWKLKIVGDKAVFESKGKTYISRMESGLWIFKGRAYHSPFEAFKEVEDELQRRVSGL